MNSLQLSSTAFNFHQQPPKAWGRGHRAPSQVQESQVSTSYGNASQGNTMFGTFRGAQHGARDTGISLAAATSTAERADKERKAAIQAELEQEEDLLRSLEAYGTKEMKKQFTSVCLL